MIQNHNAKAAMQMEPNTIATTEATLALREDLRDGTGPSLIGLQVQA